MNNSPKPFSLAYSGFKLDLVSLINNSSLPPCVIEDILAVCMRDVGELAKSQQRKDAEAYLKLEAQSQDASDIPNKSELSVKAGGEA